MITQFNNYYHYNAHTQDTTVQCITMQASLCDLPNCHFIDLTTIQDGHAQCMPYKMVTVQRLGGILKAWNNHFTQLVYTHIALVVPGTLKN